MGEEYSTHVGDTKLVHFRRKTWVHSEKMRMREKSWTCSNESLFTASTQCRQDVSNCYFVILLNVTMSLPFPFINEK
jgi:hypothetical protein